MLAFLGSGNSINARLPQPPTQFLITKTASTSNIAYSATFVDVTKLRGVGSTSASVQLQSCSVVNSVESCGALGASQAFPGSGDVEYQWSSTGNTTLTWVGKIKMTNSEGYTVTYSKAQ